MNQSTEMNQTAQKDRPAFLMALVYLLLVVIVTHAAALLMNQPAAYWQNPDFAGQDPFRFALQAGPIVYLVVVVIYVGLIGLLLRKLTPMMVLVVTSSLLLIHLIGFSRTTKCGFHPLYEFHSLGGCYALRYAPLAMEIILLALILFSARLPEQYIMWGKRILAALAILWIFFLGIGIYRAAFPPDSPWRPLAPAHSPGPRSMAAIAYDTKRNRAVLFGGAPSWNGKEWVYDNSTWEWDGGDWKEIKTSVAPAGRILHAMAYDEKLGKVILYGGQNANGNLADLWEWDGTSWHRLCPVCNPAARFRHKMIYDFQKEQIVIYGGQDDKFGLAEAWTWDGKAWANFPFRESSPALYNAPLIYDTAREQAISFMGGDWGGTWIWKGDLWQRPQLAVQPPRRDEATLVYDPLQDASILFGGTREDRYLYADTWVLREDTWTRLKTPLSPPQRSRAVAFYDPVRQSMIVYGGEVFTSMYSDMWELKLPQGEEQ